MTNNGFENNLIKLHATCSPLKLSCRPLVRRLQIAEGAESTHLNALSQAYRAKFELAVTDLRSQLMENAADSLSPQRMLRQYCQRFTADTTDNA